MSWYKTASINSKPVIFSQTIYRLPTEAELEDVHKYHLGSKDIVNGFGYTIIGRGVHSKENKQKILASIYMLCKKYPDNEEYKKALAEAQNIPDSFR